MVYLLLVRTRLTLKFANIIGKSGKFLIQGKRELFISCLLDLGLLAIPGSIIHAGIQYSKLLVQQMFRDNIQSSLHEKYLQGGNVYLIATQNSLDNPDYRMTSDTKKFCSEFTDFFRSVLKPSIDVATFSIALAQEGSYGAPGFLFVYYMLVAALMSAILPNFSYLVAKSQEKEGNLRTNHNQLVRHAEEVAFYNGESLEFEHSEKLLRNIVRHEEFIKKVKWCGGLMEALFIKHGSTAIGYLVCGGAVARMKNVLSPADLSELYFRSTQLFIPLSNAIGKLLLLRKKVGALCSSTHRIGEVFEFLDKLNSMDKSRDLLHYKENNLNEIIIEGVDIVTPQNVVLVKNFNVRITKNKHVLIMGSNGSGKSAIIRALTKLWPVKSGQISLPQEKNVFYTPQRTYLPPGTLRSLMVYPMTETEAAEKVTDEELHRYAEVMGVAHVIDREGGFREPNHNWQEVLSGGERQRIGVDTNSGQQS
ncbi:ATP-binding protein cassette, subfamily D (ALD), member 3 [Angomonas deanei]|nr:ATP-binding protein cassette, subfamily D (ALD), member 3 [Angomonas deanei]|eukprot:EPY39006.1 ATP-binding protein cassette, subfamily D (ALD), member 3 [Angomonas deanei]